MTQGPQHLLPEPGMRQILKGGVCAPAPRDSAGEAHAPGPLHQDGVPVLAGSASYALCEAMGWQWGLERKAKDARGFYGVITVSVLAAMIIQYSPIPPMKALFWSAVINGVVAVPLMVIVILLASRKSVMGKFTAPKLMVYLGWLTVLIMGVATLWMLMPN